MGLRVPQVLDSGPFNPTPEGGSKLPTATVVTFPAVDVPGTGDQRATAQAVEDAHATAEVVRQSLPYPVQTNEATVGPSKSLLKDAWGLAVAIREVPLKVDSDHLFVLHSVDPRARFIVGAIVSRALDSKEPSRLVTVSADGRINDIASYVGPSSGVLTFEGGVDKAADTDGEWVAWNEASSVRAHNLTSGDTRLLDEGPQDTPLRSFHIPQVDHGVAIWSEQRPSPLPYSSARVVPAAVRWANLSTGEVTTLSEHGAYPALSWPVVAWLEYPSWQVDDSSIDVVGRVMLRNLETGENWELPNLPGLAGLALDGDTMFFTSVFGQGFVTNLRGENPRLVAPDPGPYQRLTISERLITWSNAFTSPVYDRVLDRLVYIGMGLRESAYPKIQVANGEALAWEEASNMVELEGKQAGYIVPSDYNVYLLDTSQLPK
jgi:hypothetical protein